MSVGDADQGRITGETQGAASAEAYCATCDTSYPTGRSTCPVDGSALVVLPDESEDALLGRVLEGRFEIREQLGAGGMGTVYRAFQSSVGRDVAVKVIDKVVSRDREAVKRFMREAQLASKLSHPNTVVVHDFGQTHDGIVYLVMELLDGETLRTTLKRTGPMPKDMIVELGAQLCDALDTAHGMGIIHRDLKPGNVMLLAHTGERQLLKVLDFGLAKSLAADTTELSSSHVRMGTPMYMSPEMINADEVDARSDLYALGCTLYEMASGQPPFMARRAEVLFALHLEEAPKPLGRDDLGAIADVIMQLLAKQPGDRPQTAAAVREVLRGEAGRTSAETPVSRPSKPTAAEEAATVASGGLAEAATVDLKRGPRGEEATSRSKRPWVLLLALVLVAAVAGTYMLLQREGSSDRRAAGAPEQPATTPPAHDAGSVASPDAPPPAPTVKPVPARVVLTLESTPTATVSVGGKPAGKTPTTYQVARGDGELEVVFQRDGYELERRRVVPSAPRTVKVTLDRRRHRRYRRRTRPARRATPPKRTPRTVKTEPKPPKPEPKTQPKPEPKKTGEPDPSSIFRLKKKN